MNLYIKSLLFQSFLLIILFAGCKGGRKLNDLFNKPTPHERYFRALKDAKLDETALGRAWKIAGEKALSDSLIIKVPFTETGYFLDTEPEVVGYQMLAKKGESIYISVDVTSELRTEVFLDLFKIDAESDKKYELVASADSISLTIDYEIENSGLHVIRVQAELLQNVQYVIKIQSKPSVAFPVSGKSNGAVGSFFGDVRDAGRRKHEGIDIFAEKNTPVLAVTKGIIARVAENRLGGKVVFLRDSKRSLSYYYAHLDSQYVSAGQSVSTGDTLGVVGNTGNAKFTLPHLHFGIYSSGKGAIDPLPFVWMSDTLPENIFADIDWVGEWGRVNASLGNLRSSPDGVVFSQLSKNTSVILKGASGNWYRVKLPEGVSGYIHSTILERAKAPFKTIENPVPAVMLSAPYFQAVPSDSISVDTKLEVYGELEQFFLVKTSSGKAGWIQKF